MPLPPRAQRAGRGDAAELADIGHDEVQELRVAQRLGIDALAIEIGEAGAVDRHDVEDPARGRIADDVHAEMAVDDRAARSS